MERCIVLLFYNNSILDEEKEIADYGIYLFVICTSLKVRKIAV